MVTPGGSENGKAAPEAVEVEVGGSHLSHTDMSEGGRACKSKLVNSWTEARPSLGVVVA